MINRDLIRQPIRKFNVLHCLLFVSKSESNLAIALTFHSHWIFLQRSSTTKRIARTTWGIFSPDHCEHITQFQKQKQRSTETYSYNSFTHLCLFVRRKFKVSFILIFHHTDTTIRLLWTILYQWRVSCHNHYVDIRCQKIMNALTSCGNTLPYCLLYGIKLYEIE